MWVAQAAGAGIALNYKEHKLMHLIVYLCKSCFQNDDPNATNKLQTANVTLWSDEECSKALSDHFLNYVAGSSICAYEKVDK